jgi:hypothetical protein
MASDESKKFLKKSESRSYVNKEFNSFRSDLLSYARTFFPDRIQDFSENSAGGLFLEMAAYVGDVMSFYLDHQFNELNIETAVERQNIEKLVRSAGIKIKGASPAEVDISFHLQVDEQSGETLPVHSQLPIIQIGTTVYSNSGIQFTLMEDLDFGEKDIDGFYLHTDNGNPSFDTTKRHLSMIGKCRSGKRIAESFNIPNEHVPFRTIRLSNQDVSEILDVRDGNGNIYYEVNSLTENVVFKKVKNTAADSAAVSHSLSLIPAPFRFVTIVNTDSRMTTLRFGSGQADTLDDDIIPDPSELALPLYEKKTLQRFSINPSDLMKTRTLGISPRATTLIITYRAGGGISHNVGSKSLRTLGTSFTKFSSSLTASKISKIRSSIEVINEFEAEGGELPPNITELRSIALAAKNSQNRIVTKEDLLARVYTMPAEFGRVYRAGLGVNDENPLATILYLVSRDKNGKLVKSPNTLQDNLRQFLDQNRLISDSIDFLDTSVVDLSVSYNIECDDISNKALVIQNANNSLISYLNVQNFQIGQPLILTDLKNIIINTDGVVSLVDFNIKNNVGTNSETGNVYSDLSYDVDENITRQVLYVPQGHILHVRYPADDIQGRTT